MGHFTMRTTLRPAHPEDFDYCARLYFEGMERIIKELSLLWADAVKKTPPHPPGTQQSNHQSLLLESNLHLSTLILNQCCSEIPQTLFSTASANNRNTGALGLCCECSAAPISQCQATRSSWMAATHTRMAFVRDEAAKAARLVLNRGRGR